MKNTVATFAQAKAEGRKLAMLTAYDYSTAKLEDEAGIDGILIGDSLGNVVLGYEDTLSVTVEDMIHHSAAVARGAKNALIVCDMPFLSYEVSVPDNDTPMLRRGLPSLIKRSNAGVVYTSPASRSWPKPVKIRLATASSLLMGMRVWPGPK